MKNVYLGNTRGVARPVEFRTVDVNNDQRVDAAFFFDATAVSGLAAAVEVFSPDDPAGGLERNAGDGPLGIHFVNHDGEDYLVANIFTLGTPVELRPIRVIDIPPPLVTFDDPKSRVTELSTVHPNPFNPQTTVDFTLAASERVRIAIYDVRGSLVKELVNQTLPAGEHHATWNGIDDRGRPSASGIYFVRMIAGRYESVRKVVMLK
jgi:hypothetical protein